MKKLFNKLLSKFNKKSVEETESKAPIFEEQSSPILDNLKDYDLPEDLYKYTPVRRRDITPPYVLQLIQDLRFIDPDMKIRDKKILRTIEKLGDEGESAKKAIQPLIEKLFDKNRDIRNQTKITLSQIDSNYFASKEAQEKIPYLFKKLSKNTNDINIATEFLLNMKEYCQEEILTEIKEKERFDIQIKLLPILSVIKPVHKETLPLLFNKLKSNTPEQVKEVVIQSLSHIGIFNEDLLNTLRGQLDESQPNPLRIESLKCLGRFNDLALEASPDIIKILDDNDEEVRKAGIAALTSIGEKTIPFLLHAVNIKPTFSEKDKKEILEKIDTFKKTDQTVMWFAEGSSVRNNINWNINEFNRIINRPFLFNESLLITLMKLGFDIDKLNEYLEIIQLTKEQDLLDYNDKLENN